MASNTRYGASPLGIISELNNFNDPYVETDGSFNSIFTSATVYHRLDKTKGINRPIFSRENLHSNDIYNISTSNIIKQLKDIEHLALKYSDFAYLRDFGLYPNNRLVVLRRFANPVHDDIYSDSNQTVNGTGTGEGPGKPIATVIGYMDADREILTFNFNELWTEAEQNFVKILNDVGKDFSLDKMPGKVQLGDYLAGGANAIPLPGASELFQRELAKKLGLIAGDGSDLPVGDPNLIREAKMRRIPGDSYASGLKSSFAITMNVHYELKYINGVDPTLVYGDIVNLLLNMGTSESKFFLGGGDRATNSAVILKEMQQDPKLAIKRMIDAFNKIIGESIKKLKELIKKGAAALGSKSEEEKKKAEAKEKAGEAKETKSIFNQLKNIGESIAKYLVAYLSTKYRVRMLGVIASMTGGPSTPWHITIGNPLRPIFCSGDMYVSDVQIKMGPQLSFNDLPTHITAEIRIQPARNLGLQEIHRKFQCGTLRTTKTYSEQGFLLSNKKHLGINEKGGYKESFWSQRSGFFDAIDVDKGTVKDVTKNQVAGGNNTQS